MTDQQKGVITLIKSALDGKTYPLPEGFSMEEAVQNALRHKIIGLTYYGALNCGVDKTSEPMKALFPYLIATINVIERQRYKYQEICEGLAAEGLDYMPLKGVVIQNYYPRPEMRTMGDMDVLIRLEQYDRVSKVMQANGFVFDREEDHEFVWYSKKLEVEVHRALLPQYAVDSYGHFKDGWKLAKPAAQGTTRYALPDEDFYMYLFTHMVKHYRMAGVGIKHFVDLWVYRNAYPHMNEEYIESALEQMHLKEFHDYVMHTLQAWFADGEITDQVRYITQVVFTSGEYGLAKTRAATTILMEANKAGSVGKVKRRRILYAIFLPLEPMRKMYKPVDKVPVLLPVFWVVRWFRILICRPKAIVRFFGKSSGQTNAQLQQRQQALEFVGLEFKPEEKGE